MIDHIDRGTASGYSFGQNLRYMAMIFTHPNLLTADFAAGLSAWHGVIPYLIFLAAADAGWWAAYLNGYHQAINPLPKLLPLPDDQYHFYQALFGPLVKLAGPFVFGALAVWLARLTGVKGLAFRPLVTFYAFLFGTLALLVVAVDQAIVWGKPGPELRFALGTVHPWVFLAALFFICTYVRRLTGVPRWRSWAIILPSALVAGPLPNLFFR